MEVPLLDFRLMDKFVAGHIFDDGAFVVSKIVPWYFSFREDFCRRGCILGTWGLLKMIV